MVYPGQPVVRALCPDDWALLRDLRLRSLADAPSAFISTYDREASLGEVTWRHRLTDGRSLAAFDGETAVAVAAGVAGRPGHPSERELVGMWVAVPYRRRGVARSLFEAVAAWARDDGATVLALGVTEVNRGARAAWLRMGLQPTGRIEAAWNDPTRHIEILRVDLDPRGPGHVDGRSG